MKFVRALVLLGSLAVAAAPTVLFAQEAHPSFVGEMTGFEETPAAATLAKGVVGVQLSHDGNSAYFAITVTDASTQLVAAHLHLGAPGVAGPVVVPLCTAQTTPCQTEGLVTQGTFSASDFTGPFQNDTMQRLIDEARAGQIYANVHSTKFPGGEARGQLVDLGAMLRQPEPAMVQSVVVTAD